VLCCRVQAVSYRAFREFVLERESGLRESFQLFDTGVLLQFSCLLLGCKSRWQPLLTSCSI